MIMGEVVWGAVGVQFIQKEFSGVKVRDLCRILKFFYSNPQLCTFLDWNYIDYPIRTKRRFQTDLIFFKKKKGFLKPGLLVNLWYYEMCMACIISVIRPL